MKWLFSKKLSNKVSNKVSKGWSRVTGRPRARSQNIDQVRTLVRQANALANRAHRVNANFAPNNNSNIAGHRRMGQRRAVLGTRTNANTLKANAHAQLNALERGKVTKGPIVYGGYGNARWSNRFDAVRRATNAHHKNMENRRAREAKKRFNQPMSPAFAARLANGNAAVTRIKHALKNRKNEHNAHNRAALGRASMLLANLHRQYRQEAYKPRGFSTTSPANQFASTPASRLKANHDFVKSAINKAWAQKAKTGRVNWNNATVRRLGELSNDTIGRASAPHRVFHMALNKPTPSRTTSGSSGSSGSWSPQSYNGWTPRSNGASPASVLPTSNYKTTFYKNLVDKVYEHPAVLNSLPKKQEEALQYMIAVAMSKVARGRSPSNTERKMLNVWYAHHSKANSPGQYTAARLRNPSAFK